MSISSFTPLKKGKIRLLSFADDIPPKNDAPMSLRLTVVKLHEAPPYTALSYEWGPPSESKSILLNETPIPIRDNLFAFLQRYRESGQGGYLWIDALCINQSDVTERGQQVGIMGEVYRKAIRVVAWLGSGPPKLVEAFRELAEVVRRFPILHLPFGASFELPEQSRLEEDQISAFRVLSSSNLVTQSVSEVGQSTYWTRLWIIQEFVLAKDAEIWCGRADVWTFSEILQYALRLAPDDELVLFVSAMAKS
ncbi:hypothetical protein SLS60_000244 [Paraconiothyrium brasiliense]|uniref:Heterokaryon incompatibility domain-containing protein n=1 Tax=Paraconiothyrium brasiliense TaxID=300254 RepID=A0ABR3S5P0_9PLEO